MRLIDADKLRETIENHVTTVSVCPTADWSRGETQFKKQCLEDIDATPTVGDWISVKDRLPELSGFYLVFRLNDGMYVEYFAQHTSTWFMEDADKDHAVAYWMPLPEAPEEVSGDGQ